MRNHSVAQKLVVEKIGPINTGPMSDEVKNKISLSMQKVWENMSPERAAEVKESISNAAKKTWENRKADCALKHIVKMKEVARSRVLKGSKPENCLFDLLKVDFTVEKRKKDLIYPYEVDIFLPNEMIAIEVDGPTHFSDIYGEDNLLEVQKRDEIKNLALIDKKVTLIRCQIKTKSFSIASCRRAAVEIKKIINETTLQQRLDSPNIIFVDIK